MSPSHSPACIVSSRVNKEKASQALWFCQTCFDTWRRGWQREVGHRRDGGRRQANVSAYYCLPQIHASRSGFGRVTCRRARAPRHSSFARLQLAENVAERACHGVLRHRLNNDEMPGLRRSSQCRHESFAPARTGANTSGSCVCVSQLVGAFNDQAQPSSEPLPSREKTGDREHR